MIRRIAILALALGAAPACGGDGASSAPPADATPEDETSACASGERREADGHCEPAGIPPDGCGAGFEPDGARGCNAILPPDDCPSGQMAVPGETACHEVAPCGEGTWGDIPVEGDTQFVDRSFAGTSDGSKTAPWKTIMDGVRHAAPAAIVAIAAGSYREDVTVGTSVGFGGKPVRLWGVCPAKVEVVGSSSSVAAIFVAGGASKTEVHSLAVRGDAAGVLVSGSLDVVLDGIWSHDTATRGVDVEPTYGPTRVSLGRSLVEQSHGGGVHVGGAEATIAGVVVRDSLPRVSDQTGGRGIGIENDPTTSTRATVTLRGSLVERSHEFGVFVGGADATVEEVVVRDTASRASDGTFGRGIDVQEDPATGATGTLTVRASIVERSEQIGIDVSGSDATIERVVVRDTAPVESAPNVGTGIHAQLDAKSLVPSTLTLRSVLVESSRFVAVLVVTSDATLDGVLVRDTKARADGFFGDGVAVIAELHGAASANISSSRIEGSARAGISSFGGSISLGATSLECNGVHLDGETYGGFTFSFTDLGGSACGCAGTPTVCQILSNGLAPPEGL